MLNTAHMQIRDAEPTESFNPPNVVVLSIPEPPSFGGLEGALRSARELPGSRRDPLYFIVSEATFAYIRNKFTTAQRFRPVILNVVSLGDHKRVDGLTSQRSFIIGTSEESTYVLDGQTVAVFGALPDDAFAACASHTHGYCCVSCGQSLRATTEPKE